MVYEVGTDKGRSNRAGWIWGGCFLLGVVLLVGCADMHLYTKDELVGISLQEARKAKRLEEKGKNDEALEHYKRSLTISERPAVHCDMGELLSKMNRFDEAQEHFYAALASSPDFPRAKRGLERLDARKKLQALGKTPEEISAAMKRWDEEYVPSGEGAVARPDASETYREYLVRQGVAVDEVSVKLYERGVELARQGKTDQAIRMFREVLMENPNDARVYYNLGNLYYQNDDLRRSMMQYQTAIECDKQYAAAYNNLGVVQEALGYSDYALDNYVAAIAIGDYEPAHYNLAVLYTRFGKVEEAIKEFETYVNISPQGQFVESAKEQLGKLYRIR